jgi:hypothetical protein
MKTPTQRLLLWAGDGGLNARDDVMQFIADRIESTLHEASIDPCYLNELMAYFRCMIGIVKETGGDHLVEGQVENWRDRTIGIYDQMPNLTADEIARDRPFLVGTFNDLLELTRK